MPAQPATVLALVHCVCKVMLGTTLEMFPGSAPWDRNDTRQPLPASFKPRDFPLHAGLLALGLWSSSLLLSGLAQGLAPKNRGDDAREDWYIQTEPSRCPHYPPTVSAGIRQPSAVYMRLGRILPSRLTLHLELRTVSTDDQLPPASHGRGASLGRDEHSARVPTHRH
ncbi:hypothetical protein H920_01021 [Fukomys damarensis]|uniref:Uncharacterized protein n=1 Tax=Fukomys damarensis TaxID=885580 RepID=A0A091EPC5_FUKDA|nr:hypothetical protein H920_01021 [Fukomys damarensis]